MNNLPPMTLFDYMVSNKENNMLKAFIPFIDKDFQPMLATYIKYTEFMATIELFKKKGRNVFASKIHSTGFNDIISCLLPYVSDKERETFETINNIKNAMEMFEMYKDMISPEMMNAFSSFGNMDNSSEDSNKDNNDTINSDNVDNINTDNLNIAHFNIDNLNFNNKPADDKQVHRERCTTDNAKNNTASTTDDFSTPSDNSMTDMLSTMLSPEQRLMFEQLSGMINNT